ncbi:hypothetical protein B0675_39960 [Streptomyces sp. M41(2017)]|uniref:hypothetical protein n=1 Tax=Streptomyces sp. M41(2017) TaxID=1955065 RepID=UPI0009BF55CB|nr:hypothetical protein [Streptomyces sp. M41(2017)]OQQ12995.1 hypothetical protein B0675_39960 [Streptomyces sp. M41(2017)]
MRIIAFFKRRYPLPQMSAIFIPSVIASMATTVVLSLAGLPKPLVTTGSFVVLFAVFGITAALVDRRTRG